MKLCNCLSLLYLLCTVCTLKCSDMDRYSYYTVESLRAFYERNLTSCKILEASITAKQNINLECGRFCGTLEPCLYFTIHIGGMCLTCIIDEYNGVDHLNEWQREVSLDTYIWFKKKGPSYFVGHALLSNTGQPDGNYRFTFVNLTPVPTRSMLISFVFNVGRANKEIRFGVYRRYDNNMCNYILVHQWITISNHTGQNELYMKGVIVEKGDHIGYSFPGQGVIRFTGDTVQRYCTSSSIPELNKEFRMQAHHFGKRRYQFQGKFRRY